MEQVKKERVTDGSNKIFIIFSKSIFDTNESMMIILS